MSDNEYTPTTEQIKIMFVGALPESYRPDQALRDAEFDRWLAAHDREVAAKELTDAADDAEFIISQGEQAEVVAFPPGTTGLWEAIDRRDALLEEPVEWLRARAAALGVPAVPGEEGKN